MEGPAPSPSSWQPEKAFVAWRHQLQPIHPLPAQQNKAAASSSRHFKSCALAQVNTCGQETATAAMGGEAGPQIDP